jgi:hypothetical protein
MNMLFFHVRRDVQWAAGSRSVVGQRHFLH